MSRPKQYKCVNCGKPAAALYRTYGPSVLKLKKCEGCKAIVDKYIEYDPVIVMIDLILMSREAQRHVIYNTEFKAYWKLLIVLMLLETYGLWRNDSLFNIVVNSVYYSQVDSSVNSTHLRIPLDIHVPEMLRSHCGDWIPEQRDETDLFIWEKDFYVLFISTCAGVIMFITVVHIIMKVYKRLSNKTEVPLWRMVRAYSLGWGGAALALPMLVWGDVAADARLVHYLLVAAYGLLTFYNLLTVLYECPASVTTVALIASNIAKCVTTFHTTPVLRGMVT